VLFFCPVFHLILGCFCPTIGEYLTHRINVEPKKISITQKNLFILNFHIIKTVLTSSLLFCFIGATLISTEKHISPFGSSFYGYLIMGTFIVIFAGFLSATSTEKARWDIKHTYLAFSLYIVYHIVLSTQIHEKTIDIWHIYYGMGFLLLISLPLLTKLGNLRFIDIAKVVSLLVAIPIAVCFL